MFQFGDIPMTELRDIINNIVQDCQWADIVKFYHFDHQSEGVGGKEGGRFCALIHYN